MWFHKKIQKIIGWVVDKAITQPSSRHGVTPTHLQTQTTECGLAAMAMILSHFGRHVTLDELRTLSGVSRDCITAADLVRMAHHFGLSVEVKRKEPEDFEHLRFPFIAYLDFIHFVVIEGVSPEGVWINDPGSGRQLKDAEIFSEVFSGITLTFAKGPSFAAGGTYVTRWQRVRRHLSFVRYLPVMAGMFAGLLMSVPLVIFALGFGELIARVAAPVAVDWTELVALLFILSGVSVLYWLLSTLARQAEHKLEQGYIGQRLPALARHLLSMPYAFFVYRIAAVLHQRIYAQEGVAATLFRNCLAAVTHGFSLIILGAALFYIDQTVGAIAAGLSVCIVVFFYGLEQMARARSPRPSGTDDVIWTKLSHALENFESFKTSGGDDGFFRSRMGDVARKIWLQQRVGLFRSFAEAGADIFPVIIGCVILARSAYGDVGVAAFFSLIFLAFALHTPVRGLAALHGEGRILDQDLPLIDDLLDQVGEDHHGQDKGQKTTVDSPYILSCTDISFGFTKVKPALLQGIDLNVLPGEQIGITGPSGGGKSTFAEVLIGLHQPWTGRVELEGVSFSQLSRDDLMTEIGWVNKTPYFIAGTVRDNLLLWDTTITQDDLSTAIHDACLTQMLEDCPDGLETQVAPRGANFSGGQRQRLEIARTLVRNPRILVLDEATDGLDDPLEAQIRENLRRRGVTLLIVSHRENTLKACDWVVHLIDGQICLTAQAQVQQVLAAKGAALFGADADPTAPLRPRTDIRQELIQVFRWVAAAVSKKTISLPPASLPIDGADSGGRGLAMLARHNRLPLRYVRFASRKWWRYDHGPLIAFTRAGHRPVAILGDGMGGFVIADPSTGGRTPLTEKNRETLETRMVMLHDDFSKKSVKPFHFFVHAFHRCIGDLKSVAGATIALMGGTLAIPAAGYVLFHEIWPYGDVGAIDFYLGGVLLAGGGLLVAESYRLIALHRLEGRLETSASQALYQHVMRLQPLFFHENNPEGINRSLHAVPHILNVLRGGTLRRLLASAGCLLCVCVLASVSPVLALWACLILFWGAGVSVFLSWQAFVSVGPHLTQRLVNTDFLFQLFKNAARLRQMGREKSALEVWEKGREDELLLWHRIRQAENSSKVFLDVSVLFALVLFVIALVLGSEAHPPALVGTLVLTFIMALFCMKQTTSALCDLVRIVPFLSRLKPLTQAKTEPRRQPVPFDDTTCPVEVRNLHFSYPGSTVEVLKDVSLRVKPGQIVTLVGASGCGKSTLLRVLLGFYPSASGEILRYAKQADEIDISSWRDGVGAVFQDDQLDLALTIRGHILGQDFYTMAKIREAARLAMLEPDIDAMPMGIQTIVDGDKISTGQKQRILIAQRLIREPSLLILDEATNALPETMQADFFANLRKLGVSCLLVSHRSSAIAASDYVYHMEGGRITWSGAPSDFDPSKLIPDHKRGEPDYGPCAF